MSNFADYFTVTHKPFAHKHLGSADYSTVTRKSNGLKEIRRLGCFGRRVACVRMSSSIRRLLVGSILAKQFYLVT